MTKYLNGEGLSHFMSKLKRITGEPEAPYTEVEWVESDGKQFVYLDWKPPIATWGFEADFIIRNAFSTTVGAWNASTNVNGYGNLFGTRNASTVNDNQLSSYGTTGLLRFGSTGYTTAGLLKTDKTRQQVKLVGTSLTRGDGTTVTVTRSSETSGKYYANMTVFAMHEGARKSTTGNLVQPGSCRVYSLKFYESTTVKVDLVGAIRKSDGCTGLYDKVSEHFYPAPGMTYGSEIGDLGDPVDLTRGVENVIPFVYADNSNQTRMWQVSAPTLDSLRDGQQINLTFRYNIGSSVQTTELTGWDDTSSNSQVYLKLTLADGTVTDWIPCYCLGTTRLTSHYLGGSTLRLTYRENVTPNSSQTSTTSIMRGWFCDPYYNTDQQYDRFTDTCIAGKNGIKRYTLCMKDDEGNWTSITTTASASATGKVAYSGGLQLGKVLYAVTGADYAAGANSGVLAQTYQSVDFRYSVNGVTNAAATTELQLRKPVYLVGTLGSDGLFYLDSTKWWTQALPTTEDGKVYVHVGTAYSSYHAIFLAAVNCTYKYQDGRIVEVFAGDATTVNGHTVQSDVPANAKFTDTTYSAGTGLSLSGTTFSNAGVTGVKGNAETAYRTGDVNLTAANVGAVALSGDETVAGKKTFSGNTVIQPASTVNAPANTVIAANANAIIQSPIPKYLWHDLFAFGRHGGYPNTYWTSTDNETWTVGEVNKRHFMQQENIAINALTSTVTGVRWQWYSTNFAYSSSTWLVIGICYTFPIARYTIQFEYSTDGTTWTTSHLSTSAHNQVPIWLRLNGVERYLRLTITKDPSDTGTLNISAIKLLSSRWGNQGSGSELEFPYLWDETPNITPIKNNTSSLGSSTLKWASVYATNLTGDVTGGMRQSSSTRPTSANTTGYGAYLRYFLATSSMTTGKPTAGDGHVLDMEWDNNGKWHGQLVVPTSSANHVQWRTENGGTWTDWTNLLDARDVIPASNGGTGQTSLVNSANALINALTTGSSDPVDADYYVSQYVGGGTSTTTFQRRPMSALWNYVKGKISSVLGLTATSYGGNAATATSAGNVTGTVAIANGGTGATTAAAARTSLGAQATLVSGTNIKTINNSSILGSGNLTITGGGNMFYGWLMTPVSDAAASIVCPEFTSSDLVAGTVLHVVLDMGVTLSIGPNSTLNVNSTGAFKVITDVEYTAMPYCFSESIATFVYYDDPDGVNHGWMIPTAEYKTVNGTSVLGTGDIAVQPTLVSGTNIKTVNGSSLLGSGDIGVQPTLVSGTNIKTVNGASILGSGDVSAQSTWYGTCSTAAATAAKAVTCSGFSLTAGAMVSVLFTTANTAATPTLNVNSTGAKAVYVGSGAINATTNTLKWSANTLLTFVYDGTAFRYLGSQAAATLVPPEGAGAWYGTCATAESTAAKATTIANFRLVPGAIVNVTFTTASTVSGAITLNVNSTGAKTVYYNNVATSASNPLTWTANQTLTFVYSGSYWHYLGRSGLEEDMPSGGPSGSDSWTDVTSQFVAEDASWSAYMYDLQVLRSSTMVAINGHALGSGTPMAVPTVGRPECPTSLSIPAAISDFGPILTAGANVPSLYYSGTWLFDDGGYTGDFQLVYPLYSE